MMDALRDLASTMRQLRMRWCLLGAQAAVIHGRPRMTADIDVSVELDHVDTAAFLAAMESNGFVPAFALDAEFISATRVIPMIHGVTGMPVDIMLAGPGLEEMFIAAAEKTSVAGIEVPVIRAEHLVVMKILAGRPRDIDDVEGIVAARRRTLDGEEIEGLLTMLEAALDQSDLLPRWRDIVASAPD